MLHYLRLITSSCHWKMFSSWIRWQTLRIWQSTLHCIIAFQYFPDITFKQLCLDPSFVFFTPTPIMTPFLSYTKPLPLQGRCCYVPNSVLSGWSSALGPQPKPGRRHDLRNTMKHQTHIPQSCENLPQFFSSRNLAFRHQDQVKQPKVHGSSMIHCTSDLLHRLANLLPESKSDLNIQLLEVLCWGILEIEFWTCQETAASIWLVALMKKVEK